MDPKTLLFTMYLCLGGVLCLVSLPLLMGKIGPNPFYGLRVKRTLDDPAVWYPANRFAAWWMLAAAALLMIVAWAGYALFPRLGLAPYALTCLGALVVGFGTGGFQVFRYLRRL
jgi:hypothetical protein